MPTQADYAKIHIAIKELGLTDQQYRDILWINYQVRSSKKLNARQVAGLLELLRGKGWKPTRAAARQSRPMARNPQSRKIRALWLTLRDLGALRNPSEEALAKYVKRQVGVDALQWLDQQQHNQVIESLKSWVTREKAKRPGVQYGRKQR